MSLFSRIEKFRTGFKSLTDQYMTEPVFRITENIHGGAEQVGHGLTAAGEGGMDPVIRNSTFFSLSQFTNFIENKIGNYLLILL